MKIILAILLLPLVVFLFDRTLFDLTIILLKAKAKTFKLKGSSNYFKIIFVEYKRFLKIHFSGIFLRNIKLPYIKIKRVFLILFIFISTASLAQTPMNFLLAKKAGPGVTYATWNPSDKSADITLSGGDLVGDITNPNEGYVRGTQGKSSGKPYWEITLTTNGDQVVGIDTLGTGLENAYGIILLTGAGLTYIDGAYNSNLGVTFAQGDKVGLALDCGAHTLDFYKNNTNIGTITGLGSYTWYPRWGDYRNTATGTANFGATTMAYTAPSGYDQGWYQYIFLIFFFRRRKKIAITKI